ncbi:unnamed protein product [Protopolystoma xenopodis]|uniref:Uncharacterized protein n=1 Tax=Protopolystoma xenopodis TaxID=117903 RepID=A0A3S5AA64_9PLAT|nr:unnamed protein product [Protopolystoma xenopodis]
MAAGEVCTRLWLTWTALVWTLLTGSGVVAHRPGSTVEDYVPPAQTYALIGQDAAPLLGCQLRLWPRLRLHPARTVATHKVATTSDNLPDQPVLIVNEVLEVGLECTCCHDLQNLSRAAHQAVLKGLGGKDEETEGQRSAGMLVYRVVSTNRFAVIPSDTSTLDISERRRYDTAGDTSARLPECALHPRCVVLYREVRNSPDSNQTQPAAIYLDANTLGRSRVSIDLIWVNASRREDKGGGRPEDIPAPPFFFRDYQGSGEPPPKAVELRRWLVARGQVFKPNWTADYVATRETDVLDARAWLQAGKSGVWHDGMRVTVLLKTMIFYTAFDWSSVFVACMVTISIGCCTNPIKLRELIQKPAGLIAGAIFQIIVIPLVSDTIESE